MSDSEQNIPDSVPIADQPVPQPELTTERLVLRPFREQDAAVVQQLLQCREIAANTRTIDHPYPDGAAKIWIGLHKDNWDRGAAVVFAICHMSDIETPIGAMGLEIDADNENAELGYWVGESWWGKGVCTEAANEVIKFGFLFFGLKKIHAHHLARNPASGRVLQKAGMEKEGYFKSHFKKWGVFEDIVFFGIVTDD